MRHRLRRRSRAERSGRGRPDRRDLPAPSGNLTEDQQERKALVPKAKTGYEQALSAAVGAVPDSKPVSVELKGSPDSPRWEAEVATGDGTAHTVSVDAVGGKAGQARAEDKDSDDKRELADLLKKATVTPQQAAQTATGKTKGTVTAVELDDDDGGTPKWSVDVVTTDDWNKTTFDIDATNRKILREHVDRD
ncbi:PepSY domain-containing protein [Streptomyces nogalater]